ncbi:MAG: hypothetical protein AB7O62_08870 [Pirellulales bacterium]
MRLAKPAATIATEGETPSKFAAVCVVLFPLLVVAAVLFRLANVALDHLACPSDLVYESPNLATIQQIRAGQPIYDARVYDSGPFVLTMYTPLYHYLVAKLPQREGNPFHTGRIVSMLAMLGAAGLLFLPGRASQSWILPVVAVGAMFCVRPIVSNTVYLRHDPLGLLLSGAAVVAIAGPSRRWPVIALAGLLAAAAFLTKQSFLACGVSCVLYLFFRHRRQTALFAACWAVPILIAAAILYVYRGEGGVWFSWFTAPRNPLDSGIFLENWRRMLEQPVFGTLVVLASTVLIVALRREGTRVWLNSPYAIYWILATLALVPISAKVGAATNVFFEFVLAGLLWLTHEFRQVTRGKLASSRPLLLLLGLCFVQAMELAMAQPPDYSFVDRRPAKIAGESRMYSPQELLEGRIALVRQELAALDQKPTRLLNLTQEVWITASLTNEILLNDPLAYALLWDQNALSNAQLKAAIGRQEFDVILLPRADTPPEAEFWAHRLPAWQEIVQAVEEDYYTRQHGIYRYMTPRFKP